MGHQFWKINPVSAVCALSTHEKMLILVGFCRLAEAILDNLPRLFHQKATRLRDKTAYLGL